MISGSKRGSKRKRTTSTGSSSTSPPTKPQKNSGRCRGGLTNELKKKGLKYHEKTSNYSTKKIASWSWVGKPGKRYQSLEKALQAFDGGQNN
jgi:hypothetical protein